MPHSRKIYGQLTAPVQFERWCVLYLITSLERGSVYNAIDRREWAYRATQHIIRRFHINGHLQAED